MNSTKELSPAEYIAGQNHTRAFFAPKGRATIALPEQVAKVVSLDGLGYASRILLALHRKANKTGSPIFSGVGSVERASRRAAGKRQRAGRRAAR